MVKNHVFGTSGFLNPNIHFAMTNNEWMISKCVMVLMVELTWWMKRMHSTFSGLELDLLSSLFRNHHQCVIMICKAPLLHLLSCAVKLAQRPSRNAIILIEKSSPSTYWQSCSICRYSAPPSCCIACGFSTALCHVLCMLLCTCIQHWLVLQCTVIMHRHSALPHVAMHS